MVVQQHGKDGEVRCAGVDGRRRVILWSQCDNGCLRWLVSDALARNRMCKAAT
jgi:hypothetical protein